MDVDRIIAELELERKLVQRRVIDIDETLAALNKLRQGTRAVEPKAKPSRPPRGPASEADRIRARQMYENAGTQITRIAQVIGVSEATIYLWKKSGGWKRREPITRPTVVTVAAK